MTLYGARTTFEKHDETVEQWEIAELGVMYSSKTTTAEGLFSEYKLGAVRREEPEPKLFDIPERYVRDDSVQRRR